jgi:hypothetical protein
MRKPPPLDADRSGRPTGPDSEPVRSAADAPPAPVPATTEPGTTPSLIWPPADDEMSEWEVLQLHSTGNTIIEPLRFTPAPAAAALTGSDRPAFAPPTPAPYVPPSPIDDPVGEASLGPIPSDFDLPETELIEPLHAPTTATMPIPTLPPISGARPGAVVAMP